MKSLRERIIEQVTEGASEAQRKINKVSSVEKMQQQKESIRKSVADSLVVQEV